MKNKKYTYPKLILSVSKEDLEIAKELREQYYVNISAFLRLKLRELYNIKKNEDSENI